MTLNFPERYVMVLNLVLIAAIAWFAARVASDIITLRLASNVVPPSVTGPSVRAHSNLSHGVSYYSEITQRDIFNLAPPPQEAEKAPVTEEPLNITLLGTSHLTQSRPYAIVQDQQSNQTLYRLGDNIKGVGKLVEIDADRIVVLHNGHRVAVEIPRDNLQGQDPALAYRRHMSYGFRRRSFSAGSDGVEKLSANRYVVDRSALQDKMRNMAELFTQIRAVPNIENGTSNGFRLSEIQPGSIFQQIGLQDGDILTAVSGQPVTDPARAMELFEQLRNRNSVTLNVLRDGTPMQLYYSIR
jgi:general secretion pathway protein C